MEIVGEGQDFLRSQIRFGVRLLRTEAAGQVLRRLANAFNLTPANWSLQIPRRTAGCKRVLRRDHIGGGSFGACGERRLRRTWCEGPNRYLLYLHQQTSHGHPILTGAIARSGQVAPTKQLFVKGERSQRL